MKPDDQLPRRLEEEMGIRSFEQTHSHGAEIDNLDQPLVLYRQRNSAIKSLNRRFLLVAALFVPYAVFFAKSSPVSAWVIAFTGAYFCLLYIWQRRSHAKSLRPILEMRKEGLVLNSLIGHLELVPWSEIREVRVYRCFYRFLGIELVNVSQTMSRGTFPTRLIAWWKLSFAPLYRLFGCPLAPINIPEEYLPLSAEEVKEQIDLRRAHALGQKDPGTSPGGDLIVPEQEQPD